MASPTDPPSQLAPDSPDDERWRRAAQQRLLDLERLRNTPPPEPPANVFLVPPFGAPGDDDDDDEPLDLAVRPDGQPAHWTHSTLAQGAIDRAAAHTVNDNDPVNLPETTSTAAVSNSGYPPIAAAVAHDRMPAPATVAGAPRAMAIAVAEETPLHEPTVASGEAPVGADAALDMPRWLLETPAPTEEPPLVLVEEPPPAALEASGAPRNAARRAGPPAPARARHALRQPAR